MGSHFAFFTLFSLVLFASTLDARPDPGSIMKDQPLPEAIQGLIHQGSVSPLPNKKIDCHTSPDAINNDQLVEDSAKEKPFVTDFKPRPNISAYPNDAKLTVEKSFVKDFEPRPNVSVYDDDVGLKEEKPFVKDFEPRPNISVYQD